MVGLVDVGHVVVVDFVVAIIVWCWYTFSSFCHVYLSRVIFNLALNYNPLILFYCAIYFLTLSIFILLLPLFAFLLYPFFQSSISRCGNFKVFAFSKFNSSQMLEFDDPLFKYSSCLTFFFLISQAIALRYTWDSFFLIFGILDELLCYVWQCVMLLMFV